MTDNKKVVLMILDGWGHGDQTKSDAIHHASTPFIDSLYSKYANAELRTDGLHVGLPDGQMGNSEVGHLNIGAGRIVNQDLVRINKAVKDRSIMDQPALIDAFKHAKEKGVKLHFIGLVSDGGVHSSQAHLHALCTFATEYGLQDVFVHAFTDGRDTDPKSGLGYVEKLENHLKTTNAQLASVVGRYYAMDRDTRWERVKLAYDLLTQGTGQSFSSGTAAIESFYANGITDEFIEPAVLTDVNGEARATIDVNDVVICFNFRTDRCREITMALTQKDFPEFDMQKLALHYTTMTNYDRTFEQVNVIFDKENLQMTLGETIAKAGKTQIRIAETEKYPHVTFFFSGGRELAFDGETRLMVNSPGVPTYDLQPEMSALEVTDKISAALQVGDTDFVCLNFANPDMVGHTGVYEAVVKALETIDTCAQKVVEAGQPKGYSFVIIADHGNADFIVNEDGSPNTAHTTNPVPIFLLDDEVKTVKNGILADIAPTILSLMGIEQPLEMTGQPLV